MRGFEKTRLQRAWVVRRELQGLVGSSVIRTCASHDPELLEIQIGPRLCDFVALGCRQWE